MKKDQITPEELVQYKDHYSEDAFWDKVKLLSGKAGSKLIYYALVLYYTLLDPKTPMKYKAIIAGALGYFILPVDLMPDFLPFAGLADDWAALIAAVSYVLSSINPENKAKAREKVEAWFPFAKTDDE
jgi:uncharacterized membrane protein YkvA (DUF1232 family)